MRYLRRWAIGLLAISIFLVGAVSDWKQVALAFGTSVQSAIWVSVIVLLVGHERRTIERPR